VVEDPAFAAEPFAVHTRWIETEWDNPVRPYEGDVAGPGEVPRETVIVEVGGKRLEVVLPAGLGTSAATPSANKAPHKRGGGKAKKTSAGGDSLVSPMQGTLVKVIATDGDVVGEGDTVVVLEAMKMEQPLTAHKSGTITGLTAAVGQTVTAGAVLCEIKDA
jgi:acetyl-CoA/propionyl-CoA carboxylase biotin carboxyl carrier protein